MASVNWTGRGHEPKTNVDPSWQKGLDDCLAAIPDHYDGMKVSVVVNYIRTGHHAVGSLHYSGFAIDANILLDGQVIPTGSLNALLPKGRPHKSAKINTKKGSLFVYDIYKALFGDVATHFNYEWGGNFPSKYDPMHIQWAAGFSKTGNSRNKVNPQPSSTDDTVIVPSADSFNVDSDYLDNSDGTSDMVDTDEDALAAEEDSDYSSGLPVESSTSAANTDTAFIGYSFNLSNINWTASVSSKLSNIFTSAGISEDTAAILVSFFGIIGVNVKPLIYQLDSSVTNISDSSALYLLNIQVDALINELKNTYDFDPSLYPKAISTAIVSFFLGKNMSNSTCVGQLRDMLDIIKNSNNVGQELATYFESTTNGISSDFKTRRDREAQLIRTYTKGPVTISSAVNTDTVAAATSTDTAGVNTTHLTSTQDPSAYESNSALLQAKLSNQETEIANLFNSRKQSTNEPATPSYDDSFNDADQSTLDSIATIMQTQQTNSDVYFGYKDSEYYYRVKTKNFYTILSRKLNMRISEVEKLLTTESILENHTEYNLDTMYSMIPYSTSLGSNIKKNAVARCKYRIRLIEQRIRNNQSTLISMDVPSANSYLDNAEFIAGSYLKFGALESGILIESMQSVFGTLAVLKEMLRLETANLSALSKDMYRY